MWTPFVSSSNDLSTMRFHALMISLTSWDQYLLEFIVEPGMITAMQQGPRVTNIMRCFQPPTVYLTLDERTEAFIIRDPTPDRLLTELNARFEVVNRFLLPFTSVPRFDKLSHGDHVVLQTMPDIWARVYDQARMGDIPSILQIGSMLETSGKMQEARHWYLKAAQKGDRNAAYHCGVLAFGHSNQIEVNFGEAERWLKFAADKGHIKAKKTLAILRTRPEFVSWKLRGIVFCVAFN